ncbi:hypothetical protein LJR153_006268 [Paenibacillus sp. LjRoot153]
MGFSAVLGDCKSIYSTYSGSLPRLATSKSIISTYSALQSHQQSITQKGQ